MTEMKKLLKKLFGRRRDPIAALRAELTEDERVALQVEQFEQDRLDALRRGHIVHNEWTNVAIGSPGYVVYTLRRDGLMICQGEHTVHGQLWHYRTTAHGQRYLSAALSLKDPTE